MKNNQFHYIAILVFLLIGLFFVFGITHVEDALNYVHKDASEDLLRDLGTFGDSAGLLNALFSALAFGGVILTIFWQISESRKQRDDEHRIQFENVFFNMTNTLEHIVSELKVNRESDNINVLAGGDDWLEEGTLRINANNETKNESPYVEGREVFKYIYEEKQPSIPEIVKRYGIRGYEREMTGVFDSYFRYLYRILKYIDDSKLISHEVKYQYAGILRAHLSYMELPFIYYNCISMYGSSKMKPLVEKYHLLKNMRMEKLHDQMANSFVRDVRAGDMYNESAWETEDKKNEGKFPLWKLVWRMFVTIMMALIFNILLDDVWYRDIVSKWDGLSTNVVWGVAIILILMNVSLFRILYTIYEKSFHQLRKGDKVKDKVLALMNEDWVIPYFIFLLLTSNHVNLSHHIVWYGHLDLVLIYLPLVTAITAMIWNVTKIEQK